MINSKKTEYYHASYGLSLTILSEYVANKVYQDRKLNLIIIIFLLAVLIGTCLLSAPIFAKDISEPIKTVFVKEKEFTQTEFEESVLKNYSKARVKFISSGIAHIKKIKYINSKPVKINIVEINTKVNPNLRIKPQIAGNKLNCKKTVRTIAQNEGATIAINAGYFKPKTGVPLGALMINRNVLTGEIYNRVGIAIFEDNNNISFKMDKIDFDIKAYTQNQVINIDNVNQPRMLSTYILLYTPVWGEFSPKAPEKGLNVLIVGNKIIKITNEPIEFQKNSYVLSAPKKIIDKLTKNSTEIYVDVQLQNSLKNARHIIGAGPYLVKNKEIFVDTVEQKFSAIANRNPRSAIGFRENGSFVIVTIDGREKTSVGMTLKELARFMKEINCDYAMNFDGGSSSALYIDGKIVNNAHNKEGVAVSNVLLVTEEIETDTQISSL